ncbi:unnamed protein product [Penicillium salamii]|uniref:Uncharacterized protein n=1 Tax=Penicillium salamii TaxID=1612424 RepID=A0A9W4IQD7_9EURO|nr:unnamed protein product [Penicillium salamii]CAG8078695.1 unnamed protein product [Penicillium salamii]CAG8292584.1 unnamed protein product [Penicillium salamii]CAG8295638.1 unnamed protein product [Penicillium salamii]CAG8316150.1 unnamed protein product [Penicillium salamii]
MQCGRCQVAAEERTRCTGGGSRSSHTAQLCNYAKQCFDHTTPVEASESTLFHDNISEHIDINGAEPLLYLAAEYGRSQLIDLLLEFGANVIAANRRGHTPLHQAADQGHLAAVGLLLEQQNIDLQVQDPSGSTALHVATKRNHLSIVNLLLANPGTDINCKDMDGNTPLWWSTGLGHDDISFRLLAEAGVDLNAVGWKSGLSTTPLFHAVARQSYSLVDQLVETPELDPNIPGDFRWTPLGHAARDGNVAMVKLLLRRDDLRCNAVGPDEDSPLWLATKGGRTRVVDLLLQQGNRVDINCRNNKDGETALSAAAGSGDQGLHLVKLILEDSRTDPNAVDKSGKTAIWHADSKGHLQVANELLKDPRLRCDLNLLLRWQAITRCSQLGRTWGKEIAGSAWTKKCCMSVDVRGSNCGMSY